MNIVNQIKDHMETQTLKMKALISGYKVERENMQMEAQPTGAAEAAERQTLELRSKEAKITGLHEREGQVDALGVYINETIIQKCIPA